VTFQLPPDQRDFSHWLEWHNANHREMQLTEEEAWPIYSSYYTCNCEGCAQRKRLGYHPFKTASERKDCTAPFTAIDSAYVRSYLGLAPKPYRGAKR
jgi:hypothetical protein